MSAIWNALDNREKALLLWIVVLTERCRTPSEKIQLYKLDSAIETRAPPHM